MFSELPAETNPTFSVPPRTASDGAGASPALPQADRTSLPAIKAAPASPNFTSARRFKPPTVTPSRVLARIAFERHLAGRQDGRRRRSEEAIEDRRALRRRRGSVSRGRDQILARG